MQLSLNFSINVGYYIVCRVPPLFACSYATWNWNRYDARAKWQVLWCGPINQMALWHRYNIVANPNGLSQSFHFWFKFRFAQLRKNGQVASGQADICLSQSNILVLFRSKFTLEVIVYYLVFISYTALGLFCVSWHSDHFHCDLR